MAVPLLVNTHPAHPDVIRWVQDRPIRLSGHASIETYSVMTRLPGDLRVEPEDAARLLDDGFEPALTLSEETSSRLVDVFSRHRITGGAVYDALVALAAIEHHAALVTRDARARVTYEALGADTLIIA